VTGWYSYDDKQVRDVNVKIAVFRLLSQLSVCQSLNCTIMSNVSVFNVKALKEASMSTAFTG